MKIKSSNVNSPGRMMRLIQKIIGLILFHLIFYAGAVMAVEEPTYQVLQAEPPFELRRYAEFVVAETKLTGDFDSASRAGFRRIAGYIFGDNEVQGGGNRKIAMTAPVTVEPKDGGWRLHFVMPSNESLDTLPQPRNPEVIVRQVPAQDVVAIRFSGWTTEASIESHTVRLQAWMTQRNLKAASSPQVARYNDPFTLPWRRRNEILIPVTP